MWGGQASELGTLAQLPCPTGVSRPRHSPWLALALRFSIMASAQHARQALPMPFLYRSGNRAGA